MNTTTRFTTAARILLAVIITFFAAQTRADVTLVPAGSTWKFLDNGTNQGTAWRATAFDDTTWASGPAELGYGDADEDTIVSYGPNSSAKYITTYFRKTFIVTDASALLSLKMSVLRDDGVVVYLNGVEVRRDNMPATAVTYTTPASTALGVPQEATFYEATIATTGLITGDNVLAVELHQANGTSSDLSFDLQLIGVTTVAAPVVTRGPYLQSGTPTGVIVRWRTDVATNSRVSHGLTAATLNTNADNATVTTEHEVALTGLTPNTQYFYSVGSTTAAIAGGVDYTFFTAPPVGTAQATRVWVLGDSGTADANATAVRNAYTTFAGSLYTDLWLMLGDNAYNNGTDTEYQNAVFNMYPTQLRQSVLWPTIGNHDTASSTNPPTTLPYFQMFTLPKSGEAGGVPSGTEKYYSFDQANIHFICLDSMSSSRAAGSPMLTWLASDLAATTQEWCIVFFHHPPYTKGSHNSDVDIESIEIRANVLPLLEAGGVDLVLTGHSHTYERSFLLNGHYGASTTITPAMKLDAGSGREDGTGAYTKPAGLSGNQGAVYAVAGASGKLSNWTSGSSAEINPAPHPAMFISLRQLGSLVLDVNGPRLDVRYLRETGAITDYFTISKAVSNTPPTIAITAPLEGASFEQPANVAITADAADTDGSVVQVDFYAGQNLIGTDTSAPFGITWANAPAGVHALTASATDDLGALTTSSVVTISVAPPGPPAAPTGLLATGAESQISLTWNASAGATSYNVSRATVGGGPHLIHAAGVAGTAYTDTAVSNGTTYYYIVTAVGPGGESGPSNEASATPNALPVVGIYSPLNGAVFVAPANITLVATASDDGFIETVEFLADGAVIGTSYNSPYMISWSNVPAGSYTLTARAADNLGATTTSAPVSITVRLPNPPPSPTNLDAVPGNEQIALSWTGSAEATSYNVKRSELSGGPYALIGVVGTASFVDTTPLTGTLYFYVVSAVNSDGESANSTEANASPNTAPLVAITTPTNGANFTVPTDIVIAADAFDSEGTVTLVEFFVNGVPLASDSSAPFSVSWNGVPVGSYTLTARATDDLGLSEMSNPVAITVSLPPPPAAPANVIASAGDAQVALSWNASAGAASYTVKRATTSGGPYATIASGLTALALNDTAVTNGTAYFYVVSATNNGGESPDSAEVNATPLPPPPAAPTGLIASAGNAQVALTWNASATAASYTVKRATASGGPYATIVTGVPATNFINTGLTNGTTYFYVVSAVNIGGESADSNEAGATPLPPPPSAPTGLVASAGDAQVGLTWNASAGAASYNVKRATASGGPYAAIATGLVATAFTDATVANGTTYFYVVTAVNIGGESPDSNEAGATPLPPPPLAPTGLAASAGNAQVGLTWNASARAASYNVKRATVSGGSFAAIATGITATAFTDTTAANGTTYFYVVSAVNLGGESPDSTEAGATPVAPPVAPAAPTGLAATPGNAQAALTWNASATATSYNVKRATVSGGPYTTVATGITATTFTNTGLTNLTTYHYVVSAVNAGGESANSNQASATPAAPVPAAPSGLTATAASRTRINLAWADNSTNETGFLIERSTNGTTFTQIATVGANVTTYANNGLKKNTTYWYRVRATNAVGNSAYSNTATATTLP